MSKARLAASQARVQELDPIQRQSGAKAVLQSRLRGPTRASRHAVRPLQRRHLLQHAVSGRGLGRPQGQLPGPDPRLHQRYERPGSHDPLKSGRQPLLEVPHFSRAFDFQDVAGADFAEDRVPVARAASGQRVRERTAGRQPARDVAYD